MHSTFNFLKLKNDFLNFLKLKKSPFFKRAQGAYH